MPTNNIKVKIYSSPDEAPMYNPPEFRGADLEEVVRVDNGTENGNATLDFVFRDPKTGQRFVAMVTANLIKTAMGI